MVLGVPSFAALSVDELRGVIAHEVGHFAGGETAELARRSAWVEFLVGVRDNSALTFV